MSSDKEMVGTGCYYDDISDSGRAIVYFGNPTVALLQGKAHFFPHTSLRLRVVMA